MNLGRGSGARAEVDQAEGRGLVGRGSIRPRAEGRGSTRPRVEVKGGGPRSIRPRAEVVGRGPRADAEGRGPRYRAGKK